MNYAEPDLPLSKKVFQSISVAFGKGSVPHTVYLRWLKNDVNLFILSRQPAVLTDLSKAFGCINHESLIAKLNANGFDNSSLTFICSYLSERKQITKINSSFGCWAEYYLVYPKIQSFNVYTSGLFFEVRDLEYASFADDTTQYS